MGNQLGIVGGVCSPTKDRSKIEDPLDRKSLKRDEQAEALVFAAMEAHHCP
jgi:hypothetical protein